MKSLIRKLLVAGYEFNLLKIVGNQVDLSREIIPATVAVFSLEPTKFLWNNEQAFRHTERFMTLDVQYKKKENREGDRNIPGHYGKV